MKKIDLLLAHEDGTWTTELFDCPDELNRDDLNAVYKWVIGNLYGQTQYRKIILWAVYNPAPELDLDDPRLENDDD